MSSWLLEDLEHVSLKKQKNLGERLFLKVHSFNFFHYILTFPDYTSERFRFHLNRIFGNLPTDSAVLFDISVLPRTMLFTLADAVYHWSLENPDYPKKIKFIYSWAKEYFSGAAPLPLINLTSHAANMSILDCVESSRNAYFFLLANGMGYDTLEAYLMLKRLNGKMNSMIEDVVFLLHKTAPHNFMEKSMKNYMIFQRRHESDISYIFSSLQLIWLIKKRALEICKRITEFREISLIFIPLGPKLCQFATFFGMISMRDVIKKTSGKISFCDVFYSHAEDYETFHSKGIDYSSIINMVKRDL